MALPSWKHLAVSYGILGVVGMIFFGTLKTVKKR